VTASFVCFLLIRSLPPSRVVLLTGWAPQFRQTPLFDSRGGLDSLRFATFQVAQSGGSQLQEAWAIGANTERNTEWLAATRTRRASYRGNPGRAATRRAGRACSRSLIAMPTLLISFGFSWTAVSQSAEACPISSAHARSPVEVVVELAYLLPGSYEVYGCGRTMHSGSERARDPSDLALCGQNGDTHRRLRN
jgi:hypothetical protein